MSTEVKATTVKLTVNGKAVEVAAGTTILQASIRAGFYIPTLCYLQKLKPIGSCRICSVEIEGLSSPIMSCKTPVAEGMAVTTRSESLTKYRQDMMKMILVDHPLDCPVCERAGECSLQNKTKELDVTGHDWKTNHNEKKPRVDWSLIQYDENLCIMCERCIKVCREVQGVAAYKIDGTGVSAKINTVSGEELDCDFCGQCISVCPVGALSSGMGFSGRSWEMTRTETICPHCSVGCSFHLNTKNGKVVRVTSHDDIGINNGNLCSRGRFGYEFIQSEDRLDAPLLRTGNGFQASNWDEALGQVVEKLNGYKALGKDAIVGIGSERGVNEDNYLFQKFFREVLGSGNIDNIANMTNPDICSRMFELFDDFPLTCNYDELIESNLFVFIGADGSNENPVISNMIREANMDHGAEVAIAYSREGVFKPAPKVQLPYEYTKMNNFVASVLEQTVAVAKKSDLSVKADAAWVKDISACASEAVLDEELQSKVEDLVELTSKRGNPLYLIGQEAQRHPQSTAIIQNIVNLAKLNGGKVMILREYCNTQGVNDMGVTPNVLPGYKVDGRKELKSSGDIIKLMESGKAKCLIVSDEDILRRYHDAERLKSAMEKVEYIIVIDQFYNKTCLEADVILPSSTSAEKNGTYTNLEGRAQRLYKTVDNVGQSISVWKILTKLASKMGTDWGYDHVLDVKKEIAKEVPLYKEITGDEALVDYRQLITAKPALKTAEPAKIKHAKGDFVILQDHSIFGLGTYTDLCPALRPLLGKPYADFHLQGKPIVHIHPADADKLGAGDKDPIELSFGFGDWTGQLKLNGKVRTGTLRVPDEMDHSTIKSVKVNGKELTCFNLAKIRG